MGMKGTNLNKAEEEINYETIKNEDNNTVKKMVITVIIFFVLFVLGICFAK